MEGGETLIERLRLARENKDLAVLFSIVEEIASIGVDIPVSQLCSIVSEVGRLRGYLENSDSRGWKKTGKITKDNLVHACNRALRSLIGSCGESASAPQSGNSNHQPIHHCRKRKVRVF
jgi:hypothetical protein